MFHTSIPFTQSNYTHEHCQNALPCQIRSTIHTQTKDYEKHTKNYRQLFKSSAEEITKIQQIQMQCNR